MTAAGIRIQKEDKDMEYINLERLKEDLLELAQIGKTDTGINRIAYSNEFWEACLMVKKKMTDAGMSARIDSVGNVIGVLPGRTDRRIVTGSHLDSVPDGGIFDGCLGVMAALEAVRTLKEHGIVLTHTLEVVAFAEEEGVVIGGLLGSKAYAGLPFSEKQTTLMPQIIGISPVQARTCRHQASPIDCFVELHIEQGGVLEAEHKDIGIVEAIVGIRRFDVEFPGVANHAGSTPMYLRDDALLKAARFIERVNQLVKEIDSDMVGTAGSIHTKPDACNIIAGSAKLILELRSVREESMDQVLARLEEEFLPDGMEIRQTFGQPPVLMSDVVQNAIRAAGDSLGLKTHSMVSGAGHDTMVMAEITASGMIFVPSKGGVSHSKDEWTDWPDVGRGADALLQTLKELDKV